MIGDDIPAEQVLEARLLGALEYHDHRKPDGGPGSEVWWLHRRVLPDGRVLHLVPMLHGNLRLGISANETDCCFADHWCYHDADAAWRNVLAWDGSGEPDGWYRHYQTARRRPDGTIESEYIEP